MTAEDHGDAGRLQEAGFCAYLRKPVPPQNVLRAVDFCLGSEAEGKVWIVLPPFDAAPPVVEH